MTKWAFRRRFYIAAAVFLVFSVVGLVVWFTLLRPEPTLRPELEEPLVLWSRALETEAGVYNALAYASSVGLELDLRELGLDRAERELLWAPQAEVRFDFYAADGRRLETVYQETAIPPDRGFRVFAPRVRLSAKPEWVTVGWERINWQLLDRPVPALEADNVSLSAAETRPQVEAEIINSDFFPVYEVEATAEVYQPEPRELVGISRTTVDSIPAESRQSVIFTWPRPFPVTRERQEVLTESGEVDIVMILDRSGSMAAESYPERGLQLPLQPMRSVLEAAEKFVDQIRVEDQLAVVSFATEASDPPDAGLSLDDRQSKAAIKEIEPLLAEKQARQIQYTNTGDALRVAREELVRRGRSEAHQAVIYLTDGEAPNRPLRSGEPDYPSTYALSEAGRLKDMEVEIYTISLGEAFDDTFVLELATSPDHHANAPTVDFLDDIYSTIAEELRTVPLEVEVYPRVLDF